MPVPTDKEIAKKEKELEDLLKKLDEDGRIRENLAISSLRSAIRKEWMRAPNKLAALALARVPDLDPNTRTKWLYKCAITGKLFKAADVEVDHCFGNHSFTKIEDFPEYWDKILNAPLSELQVVNKESHAIKTYMEKHNITWEEAVARKAVIKKMKQTAKDQKKELLSFGFQNKDISNEEKRESCYEKLWEEGKLG